MALFSDEPRFAAADAPLGLGADCSQIRGFSKSSTQEHVGPAAYYSSKEEEKRNGWASRSFSRREPMNINDRISKHETSRSDSYIGGTISKGIMLLSSNTVTQSRCRHICG